MDAMKERLSADPLNGFVVGAFQGGALVGTAGLYREQRIKERHKGHVYGVYVTPSARGRGISRAMMEALLQRANGIGGITQLALTVSTTQTAGIRLYRSLGFESFGLERRALKVGDWYVDKEYMALYFRALGERG